MIISDRRAIEDERRKNLLGSVLENEGAALRVVGAPGRAILGDDETVAPGDRLIRSDHSFEPQEVPVRLCANHTFYLGWRRRRHFRSFVQLEALPHAANS